MRCTIIYKLKVLDVLFGETFTFESICFLLFTGKAEIDVTVANVLSVCWMWNWFFDRHGLFCEFFWTPKCSQKYETLKLIKWKSNGWRGGWLAKIVLLLERTQVWFPAPISENFLQGGSKDRYFPTHWSPWEVFIIAPVATYLADIYTWKHERPA